MDFVRELRSKFKEDRFEFSKHAVDQTILREIAVNEIREAIETGEIIEDQKEKLVKKEVTYTLYKDGQFFIVENVPARVDVETGEQYFSPKTVEHLHKIILGQKKPARTIQTPVYDFS